MNGICCRCNKKGEVYSRYFIVFTKYYCIDCYNKSIEHDIAPLGADACPQFSGPKKPKPI